MQWSPKDNWLDPEEYKYHHSKQSKKCHGGLQLLSCCQNLISLTLLHTTGTSQKQKVSQQIQIANPNIEWLLDTKRVLIAIWIQKINKTFKHWFILHLEKKRLETSIFLCSLSCVNNWLYLNILKFISLEACCIWNCVFRTNYKCNS